MKKLMFLILPFLNISPANISPVCYVTNPVNNAYITAGTTLTVKATATDADGTIKRVEFYRNDVFLKTETTAPYQAIITNIQPGRYEFKARATDNLGAVKTSTVIVIYVHKDYDKRIDSLKLINATLQNLIIKQSRNDSIIIDILQKQISDLQNAKPTTNDSLKNVYALAQTIGGDLLNTKLEVLDLKDSLVQLRKEYNVGETFRFWHPLKATRDSINNVIDIRLWER